jgi:Xaa-Pro aminopeptidase
MSKEERMKELQRRLVDEKLDLLLSDDPDTIYYLTGFWGYLGVEFGRPTIVVVPRTGAPSLITPAMEAEMARALSWVEDIREWTDGVGSEWLTHLRALVQTGTKIGIERNRMHSRLQRALAEEIGATVLDGASILSAMRMVKTLDEIAVMRQAGEVAIAMAEGARGTIAEGVPEYEVALAVITAGTRKAAEFLSADGPDRLVSPTIYNLQIIQSGRNTCMVHGRSTVKRLVKGDPVYLCFCGIANFKQFKLGFDREFFVGQAGPEEARLYETAVRAQQTALAMVRPGAIAEEVHAAAEEVYRSAGFGFSYRTGRGIGYSFLEEPQLKRGDKTRLQPGMTFAVDGGITVPGKIGARIGDSIVVTESGFEYLTPYPRELTIV